MLIIGNVVLTSILIKTEESSRKKNTALTAKLSVAAGDSADKINYAVVKKRPHQVYDATF